MDTPDAKSEALPRALDFIRQVELPSESILEGGLESFEESATTGFLDPGQDQAVAVGSGVTSFLKGVDPARRRAIADSLLLAQLVANQSVPDHERIDDWYKAYFDVLATLGWVIENRGFSVHEASGRGVEAHEAILSVAAVLLGPAPAALAVVKATLNALKGLGSDNGWITLFNRDQQHAKAGRFQIALAQEDTGAGCTLAMMAFALEATSKLTQVLFVKVRLAEATLRKLSTTLTIDPDMLAQLHPEIQTRVGAFQKAYLRTLPPLALPA
ncbi:hypothetical protein [Massilia sp. Leaf139]|uniref:hypothetical protein n=1 Tax=Massilia sp. Leaf139 TaxID=1736272 RepID=UPI0006FE3E87|nr:hypothetical protein [Massilia sp. Leaf139]KQQ86782.1 hypothetical protein ASF77_18975 [Massilia sp. Leaf139]